MAARRRQPGTEGLCQRRPPALQAEVEGPHAARLPHARAPRALRIAVTAAAPAAAHSNCRRPYPRTSTSPRRRSRQRARRSPPRPPSAAESVKASYNPGPRPIGSSHGFAWAESVCRSVAVMNVSVLRCQDTTTATTRNYRLDHSNSSSTVRALSLAHCALLRAPRSPEDWPVTVGLQSSGDPKYIVASGDETGCKFR